MNIRKFSGANGKFKLGCITASARMHNNGDKFPLKRQTREAPAGCVIRLCFTYIVVLMIYLEFAESRRCTYLV